MVSPTVTPLDTFTPVSTAVQRTEGYEAAAPKADELLQTLAKLARGEQDAENVRVSEIASKIGTRVAAGEEFSKVVSEYLDSGKTPRQLRADLAKATTAGDLSKLDNNFFVRNFEESVVRGRGAAAEAAIMGRLPEVVDAIEESLTQYTPGPLKASGGHYAARAADAKVAQILQEEQGEFFGMLSDYGQTLGTQILSSTVAKARAAATNEAEQRASNRIVQGQSETAFAALNERVTAIVSDSNEDLDIDETINGLSANLTQWWDKTLETGTPEERRANLLNLFTVMSRQIQVDVKDFDDQEQALEALRDTFESAKSGSGNKIFPDGSAAMGEILKEADAFLDETSREKAYAGGNDGVKREKAEELMGEAAAEHSWYHVAPRDQTPEQQEAQRDFILELMEENPSLGLSFENMLYRHHTTIPKQSKGEDSQALQDMLGTLRGNGDKAFELGYNPNKPQEFINRFDIEDRPAVNQLLAANDKKRANERIVVLSDSAVKAAIAQVQKGVILTPETFGKEPETMYEQTVEGAALFAEISADLIPNLRKLHEQGDITTLELRDRLARQLTNIINEQTPLNVDALAESGKQELKSVTEEVTQGEGSPPKSSLVFKGPDRAELSRGEGTLNLKELRDLTGYADAGPFMEGQVSEDGKPQVARPKRITDVQYGGRAQKSIYLQAAHLTRILAGDDFDPKPSDLNVPKEGDDPVRLIGRALNVDDFKEAFEQQKLLDKNVTQEHRQEIASFIQDEYLLYVTNNGDLFSEDYNKLESFKRGGVVDHIDKKLVNLIPSNMPLGTGFSGYDAREQVAAVVNSEEFVTNNPELFPNFKFNEDGVPEYDLSRLPIQAFRVPDNIKGAEYNQLVKDLNFGEVENVRRAEIMSRRDALLQQAFTAPAVGMPSKDGVIMLNPAEVDQLVKRNPVAKRAYANAQKVYKYRNGKMPDKTGRAMTLKDRAALGRLYTHFLQVEQARSKR